ncbi:DUF1488 family protein [Burkholderia sp. 3C]
MNRYFRKPATVLQFPNPSRSYDASRHCVCFWGYDNSREISFMVDDAVLRSLQPDMGSDEHAMLVAFDAFRDTLLKIAQRQYVGGPQNRYLIS